ncbi:MHS family MFS transporter [Microbispora rosea]|nr:MHS family MFS transporter [Microbispora rosea]
MRRILASSLLGSAIEFYDFLLYASASALVFAHAFFASLDAMCSRSRRRSSFSARSSR